MNVSAVIIARNEEQMLPGAVASLAFADEVIIVVDSFSTDRTATVARKTKARVFKRKFDTFANQKNFGIRKASKPWVLILDADERVSSDLARRIRETADDSDKDAYRLKIINILFGQRLKHGNWDERHVRLIRKKRAKLVGLIHEDFQVDEARVGHLPGAIWHLSHRSLSQTVQKTVRYGDLWAARMVSEKHPRITSKALLSAPAKSLWRRLVRHAGWRDGVTGVVAAGFDAFASFYAFAALWSQQRKPSLDETYRKLERRKW
jgi:glycosyltransferase involved in cell wall biosynthesis